MNAVFCIALPVGSAPRLDAFDGLGAPGYVTKIACRGGVRRRTTSSPRSSGNSSSIRCMCCACETLLVGKNFLFRCDRRPCACFSILTSSGSLVLV